MAGSPIPIGLSEERLKELNEDQLKRMQAVEVENINPKPEGNVTWLKNQTAAE